jgi:Holliday junction resolvase RusA-like endonuclease
MLMVNFTVYGPPQGKARPRFRKIGNFVQTYTPAKTKSYEDEIKMFAKAAMGGADLIETPVEVFLYIKNSVPVSYSKKRIQACLSGQEKPITKTDIDNIAKAFLDGMNGIVYKDDRQVVELHATKVYAEIAGVEVLVKEHG